MAQDDDGLREVVLEAMEASLEAQLKAVRRLRSPTAPEPKPKRRSQTEIVYDVLVSAGGPLHINEIIHRAKADHGRQLNRESIVSALTKKVAAGDRFVRTDKNTFAIRK